MFEYLNPADGPVIEGLEKHEIVLAEEQPEYKALRALRGRTKEVPVVSRWTLTPDQRKAIAEGADLFLTLWTFGHPFQPASIAVSDKPNPDYFEFTLNLEGP